MRKTSLLPLLLMAGAAACQQPSSVAPTSVQSPEQTSPPEALPPAERVVSLAGAWRVTAIDDRPIEEPHRLELVGDVGKLWWEPRCAGMVRNYRIDGSSILFGSAGPPRSPGSPPPPVCAIGLPPRLNEVFRALDAARSLAPTPENGVRISGGGYSLTLIPR